METYELYMACSNCGEKQVAVILKGVLSTTQKCSRCGCTTLSRVVTNEYGHLLTNP